MAAKRNNQMTPFEVMQNQHREDTLSNRPSETGGLSASRLEGGQSADRRPLSDRQQGPLVIRVPPGYALVLGLAAMGMIVLAYWVGYDRGDKARLHIFSAQQEAATLAQEKAASLQLESQSGVAEIFAQTPYSKKVTSNGESGNLRQSGLNYFMLVLYPKADAQRLIAFLGAQGVEAAAIPSHNNDLYQVLALKGFRADELQSRKKRDYEALLRKLGRLWKTKRHGAGDLSDMYLALYKTKNSNPK